MTADLGSLGPVRLMAPPGLDSRHAAFIRSLLDERGIHWPRAIHRGPHCADARVCCPRPPARKAGKR